MSYEQNEMPPRIRPLMPDEWDTGALDALSVFPSGRDYVQAHWQTGVAQGMHGLGVILRNPILAKAFLTFNNHVTTGTKLSRRDRELLILRIGWIRRSEYEVVQHLLLARKAGLTESEVERVLAGPDAPGWSQEDADLLRAVDELNGANARIEPATWAG